MRGRGGEQRSRSQRDEEHGYLATASGGGGAGWMSWAELTLRKTQREGGIMEGGKIIFCEDDDTITIINI